MGVSLRAGGRDTMSKSKVFKDEVESLLTVKRPLTKLAQQLQPQVALVRIEEVGHENMGEMKLFKVVVKFGGGERELSGFCSDELEVDKVSQIEYTLRSVCV